ncbi:TetR/AcrR family transcriptional regulator [Acinetobacter pragensis]|uniref:TetR family transcriptional regulator n=1 Tax=Acinetobacter pragensis TaxID=1806892 RepID=A0A151Y2G3_9GAMM|nr:TetR/AcrR family transcriptional regulator [Acinetobacter pragensis]KYQ72216.1 TetR family transcriptional regulator [Acinetobacter pragensis]
MSKSAQKLLNTAEQLFNQHSFSAVGVDLIRDESGCSKTTLYTYFSNKHQLVKSVLQARDQRFKESLLQTVQNLDKIDALEKIYDWHMKWFQEDHFKGCLFVRAVGESNTDDKEIIEIAQAHKKWLRLLIDDKTAGMQRSHDISVLFYLQLEGLISRYLVEGYSVETAAESKKIIFGIIQQFQNSAL